MKCSYIFDTIQFISDVDVAAALLGSISTPGFLMSRPEERYYAIKNES
jgi:hypothetical protein